MITMAGSMAAGLGEVRRESDINREGTSNIN